MTADDRRRSEVQTLVIGASFAGLLAAAAAAAAGHQVTVVERDRLPAGPDSRPGVPQDRQPHILLRRGLDAVDSLLPGLAEELVGVGGVRFNTGQIPWLGEFGWNPLGDLGHDIVSLSRPLLESVVRRRVVELPQVRVVEGRRVTGLGRDAAQWHLELDDGDLLSADVVVDATGRTSRLPHWLSDLGVRTREPAVLAAGLGYASRRYRGTSPLGTGVVVLATPEDPRGGLALRIEADSWLVSAAGYGEHRPGRSTAEFTAFLAGLRDPALAELTAGLEPATDVAVHRQTANQRHAYGVDPDWPAGLLVVGDALCAFNPIYGQGITVAALEAEVLHRELARTGPSRPPGHRSTRRIQRRLRGLTELPWSVATASDRRILGRPSPRIERLTDRWMIRLVRLATGGSHACGQAFADVYHLIGSPLRLVGPRVVAEVARSLVTGVPEPARRPAVLAEVAERAATADVRRQTARPV